jgi:Icc-related predicted phosphoesterase
MGKTDNGDQTMRIYAVADIHNRPNRLALIHDKIVKTQADILIVAGDITSCFKPAPVVSRLNDMPVPVLVVRGNSDPPWIEKLFKNHSNISSLHLTKTTIKGIGFTGVSGTVPVPFRSRICFNEKPVLEKISQLLTKDDVLVAHPPPFGILDRVLGMFHAGCRSLYNIIVEKQPRLFICGHIHENLGTAFISKTLVVNCSIGKTGAGALIQLDKGASPDVKML